MKCLPESYNISIFKENFPFITTAIKNMVNLAINKGYNSAGHDFSLRLHLRGVKGNQFHVYMLNAIKIIRF